MSFSAITFNTVLPFHNPNEGRIIFNDNFEKLKLLLLSGITPAIQAGKNIDITGSTEYTISVLDNILLSSVSADTYFIGDINLLEFLDLETVLNNGNATNGNNIELSLGDAISSSGTNYQIKFEKPNATISEIKIGNFSGTSNIGMSIQNFDNSIHQNQFRFSDNGQYTGSISNAYYSGIGVINELDVYDNGLGLETHISQASDGINIGAYNISANTVVNIKPNGVGINTPNPGAGLDIRAQGVLSTDKALRVRNSQNTNDILSISSNGEMIFNSNGLYFNGNHSSVIDFNTSYYDNTGFRIGLDDYGNNTVILTNRLQNSIINRLDNIYNGALSGYYGAYQGYSAGLKTSQFSAAYTSYLSHPTSNFVIGSTTAGARLDVRAQGALSTDIALRVRNTSDTRDLFSVNGNGSFIMKNDSTNQILHINSTGSPSNFVGRSFIVNSIDTGGILRPNNILINANDNTGTGGGNYDRILMNNATDAPSAIQIGSSAVLNSNMIRLNGIADSIGFNNEIGTSRMAIGSNLRWVGGGTSTGMYAFGTSIPGEVVVNGFANAFIFGINAVDIVIGGGKGNLAIGGFNPTGFLETNTLFIPNGIAPTTNHPDVFKMFSADVVAGNAVPHFRTETGDVINLAKETTAITSSTYVHTGSGNVVHDNDTFDGYTIGQVVKALKNRGLL